MIRRSFLRQEDAHVLRAGVEESKNSSLPSFPSHSTREQGSHDLPVSPVSTSFLRDSESYLFSRAEGRFGFSGVGVYTNCGIPL